MSRLDVVAVALRVLAVFLVVMVLRFAGAIVQVLDSGSAGVIALYVLLTVVPPLGAATLIWFFPLTLATKFLPVASDAIEPLPSDPGRLQEVAFSVLGLWVLATAVSDATYWGTYLIFVSQMEVQMPMLPPDQKASFVATIAELLLGLWLLLGGRGIIGAIARFRQAGS